MFVSGTSSDPSTHTLDDVDVDEGDGKEDDVVGVVAGEGSTFDVTVRDGISNVEVEARVNDSDVDFDVAVGASGGGGVC